MRDHCDAAGVRRAALEISQQGFILFEARNTKKTPRRN
jgi:hypothetical protein